MSSDKSSLQEDPVPHSSGEPHENCIASDLSESPVKEKNAWCHLKTITTFDSEVTNEKTSYNPNDLHAIKQTCSKIFQLERSLFQDTTDQKETYCKISQLERSLFQDATDQEEMCVKHKDSNFDLKELHQIKMPNSNLSKGHDRITLNENISISDEAEILKANKLQRRQRSQSNSLSEGHVPNGSEADPVSHYSVSSSPHRNGIVSDVGVNRTNASMRSCSPAPVQSLTRFSPRSLLVESLIDQLCKLMEKDSRKQKELYHVICERLHQMELIDDTYTIEEFQFMRSHYQKSLYHFLAVAKLSTQSPGTRNILLPMPSSSINVDLKLNSEQILEWSRYQHEYQELEYIAKGGFGCVYKVRNKLDGGEYAIKKIHLRYRYVEGFLRSLKEVKMLARLNHPNIVSYKAAWLEPLDNEKHKADIQKSSQGSTSQEPSVSIMSLNSLSQLPLPPASMDVAEDSLDIVFQESSPENKSSGSKTHESHQNLRIQAPDHRDRTQPGTSLQHGKSTSSESTSQHSFCTEIHSSRSSAEAVVCPVKPRDSKRSNSSSTILRNWATLYVQMQLCERTLRQWLDERNNSLPACPLSPESSDGMLALNLFKKIVRGVNYIHNQGIVHHDIKPSNVFVNASLKEVQVGDFGLSCCILSRVDSSGVVGDHHGQVGTRLYAAPEQLLGKCTSKSDVYSLGIVFLELLQPFHTDMERSKVIQKLRTGHLPPELVRTWPHAARLIDDLLAVSPAARPSASELLQQIDSLLRSNIESDFSSQLALKDETIRILQNTVALRDQEIAELRRRLSHFEKE